MTLEMLYNFSTTLNTLAYSSLFAPTHSTCYCLQSYRFPWVTMVLFVSWYYCMEVRLHKLSNNMDGLTMQIYVTSVMCKWVQWSRIHSFAKMLKWNARLWQEQRNCKINTQVGKFRKRVTQITSDTLYIQNCWSESGHDR